MITYVPYNEWAKDKSIQQGLSDMFARNNAGIWQIKTSKGWSTTSVGGCYGTLPSTPGIKSATGFRILVWDRNINDDTTKWWFENIVNSKTSPWKETVALLEEPKVYLGNDVETSFVGYKAKKYGVFEFTIPGTSSMRNLMSMMIAIRQSVVEPGSVSLIKTLYDGKSKTIKDLTFAETVAIAVFTHRTSGKRLLQPNMFITGNGWLGSVTCTSPRHIAHGEYCDRTLLIKNVSGYYPSDATWNNKRNYDDYKSFLEHGGKSDKYVPVFKFNVYGDAINTASNAVAFSCSFENVLEFLRKPILV